MAIYNIFDDTSTDYTKLEATDQDFLEDQLGGPETKAREIQEELGKDRFFSSLAARVFFFFLLLADLIWGVYTILRFVFVSLLLLLTGNRIRFLKKHFAYAYLNLKRFFVCGLSLFVAIFSPALGIMFACTYFLMYDKEGIEEIVPSILQSQFKEFFAS